MYVSKGSERENTTYPNYKKKEKLKANTYKFSACRYDSVIKYVFMMQGNLHLIHRSNRKRMKEGKKQRRQRKGGVSVRFIKENLLL